MSSTNKLGKGRGGAVLAGSLVALAAGLAGGAATYLNLSTALGSKSQAASIVLAGEGGVFVAAITYVVLAVLGGTAPKVVRLAMAGLPLVGVVAGFLLADGWNERVTFTASPLTMWAGAEGLCLIARRVVVFRDGRDVNAEARQGDLIAKLAHYSGQAAHHPSKAVKAVSTWKLWRLRGKVRPVSARQVEQLADVWSVSVVQGARDAFGAAAVATAELNAAPVVPVAGSVPADVPAIDPAGDPADPADGPDQSGEVIPLQVAPSRITSGSPADPADPADGPDQSAGRRIVPAAPKHTDAELMAAGRRIMAKLDPPRTQNRFFAAMRAEGFRGSRDRLTVVHKSVKAELEAEEAQQAEAA